MAGAEALGISRTSLSDHNRDISEDLRYRDRKYRKQIVCATHMQNMFASTIKKKQQKLLKIYRAEFLPHGILPRSPCKTHQLFFIIFLANIRAPPVMSQNGNTTHVFLHVVYPSIFPWEIRMCSCFFRPWEQVG